MITPLEITGLQGILDSDFRDGGHPVNCPVWSWSANPFESKRKFSGVIASLVKKGLATSCGEGEDACVTMTAAGWEALKATLPITKRLELLGFKHKRHDDHCHEIYHDGQLIGLMDAGEAAEFLATQEV